eukprot:TRINITY_DN555_c0_g1_i10.p1 TRINITY_DN555_c0_g1~~TRINITY_DN555_c0_g1_i10.p1  ORF type:complete len:540 (+),score=124.91 TRINITY_DN555_c0_g1_i10:271-1890(+)
MGGGEGDQETSGVAAPATGESEVTLQIRCTSGSKFAVKADLESTVGAFKAILVEKCDIPAEQQRLIYKGRILKDDNTLRSYGLLNDHTIHLVRGSPPLGSANVSTQGNDASPNKVQSQPTQGLPSNNNAFGGAGVGNLLFPGGGGNGTPGSGLGGNGLPGLFGTGLPELQQVQQQLSQNPNIMREMMNMPAIQNLMNNPDLMRNLIMNNPQMREIIDRNPDLAHILNDPGTLRQTLEAARNPELMREMMRNTDRAMSNIESSPEGFNMLRRMYETVQEPFLNATTMGGDSGNDDSNPFGALLGQGQGQNRSQTTNPSTTGSDANGSPAPNTNPLPNPWSTASNVPGSGDQPGQANAGARATRPAGVGGIPGLSDFAGIGETPGIFDPTMLQQMLQNPAILQTMQGLLSNPQYLNQFRPLFENTPLREMLQNPDVLRQLTSQENMQQNLLSQLSRQPGGQDQGGAGGGTIGLETLVGMFGGLGSMENQNPTNVPPEELYATQLAQLQEMGFYDTRENIRALTATGGNVHAAVERLLGNLG